VEFIPEGMMGIRHYGLPSSNSMDQTNLVEEEIQEFLYWETNGNQLDRSGIYARKVQVTTIDNHSNQMKAYLGFVVAAYKRDVNQMSLTVYLETPIFFSFISFLMERKVSRGHMLHHISLANKIVAFLKSKSIDQDQIQHCLRLSTWISVSVRVTYGLTY
jgi:hypothetical protein